MRKLVVLAFTSLDGVMQAPGGPEEDPSGGFNQGGWVAGYWDDFLGGVMGEQMKPPFDLLLGRKTYQLFAAFWPNAGDAPGAKELNSAKKFVVSRTLENLEWANSVLLSGDAAQEIMKIKQGEGPEIQVHGSSNLIQTLLRSDLIDEFRLKIFPITLGAGKRLFADGAIPAGFELVDCRSSPSGVLVATYRRAGEVKRGSFAEPPAESKQPEQGGAARP